MSGGIKRNVNKHECLNMIVCVSFPWQNRQDRRLAIYQIRERTGKKIGKDAGRQYAIHFQNLKLLGCWVDSLHNTLTMTVHLGNSKNTKRICSYVYIQIQGRNTTSSTRDETMNSHRLGRPFVRNTTAIS